MMRRMGWMAGLVAAVGALLTQATVATGSTQLQQTSEIAFANVTRSSGVAFDATITWGSNWVDHDADGDPDLFANRHWKKPRFYRNVSASYHLRSESFQTPGIRFYDRHTCAWGEANGDGRLDLYCGGGAQSGEGSGPNQLWIQSASGDFSDRTATFGTQEVFGRTRHVNWIDYDTDGDLDIFIGNKERDNHPNLIFRNDRGSFARVDAGLSTEIETLASSWSDWDRDGDPDLLITRYAPDTAVAYENDGGTFTSVSLPGITDRHWLSAAWGDFDGDGKTDLSLTGRKELSVFRNTGGTFIKSHTQSLTRGASSAWADLENDGDLDLFVVQARSRRVNRRDFILVQNTTGWDALRLDAIKGPRGGTGESVAIADYDRDGGLDAFVTNGAPYKGGDADEGQVEGRWMLYRNRSAGGSWVGVQLKGDDWNPLGYGARISVTAGLTSYERELNDGLALRAQSEVGYQVMGIGSAMNASITVEWPDGTIDCVNAQSGAAVTVTIGQHPCP